MAQCRRYPHTRLTGTSLVRVQIFVPVPVPLLALNTRAGSCTRVDHQLLTELFGQIVGFALRGIATR